MAISHQFHLNAIRDNVHICVTVLTSTVTFRSGANLDLAFGRTKEQGSNSKLWDSRPLVVKVMAKYYISINNGIFH